MHTWGDCKSPILGFAQASAVKALGSHSHLHHQANQRPRFEEPSLSHDVPAILGGSPRFERPIPVVRPTLPGFDQVADELRSIISSGMLTKGSRLRQFEEAVAAHLGVQHAVAVSSCTTGLMLSYQGLGLTG